MLAPIGACRIRHFNSSSCSAAYHMLLYLSINACLASYLQLLRRLFTTIIAIAIVAITLTTSLPNAT